MRIALLLVAALAVIAVVRAKNTTPENIHLALGGNATSTMVVSWKTKDSTSTSIVNYGTASGSYPMSASGNATTYSSKSGYNHNVKLSNLSPNTTYYYVCGDANGGMSEERFFTTTPMSFEPHIWAIYGDLGIDNSEDTMALLNNRAQSGRYSVLHHLGDISYANDHPLKYEKTWDTWFNSMQPLMSSVPYMASPGNHESWCRNPVCAADTRNFTTFKEKFRMPGNESGSGTNMFYSYDFMNVHFVSISTESDFPGAPLDPSPKASEKEYFQTNWLIEDLEKAVANRKNVPWIFVGAHRPIYCAVDGEQKNGVPTGEASKVQKWLEPFLHQYNVDIFFTGHAHCYSRAYPTYENEPTSTSFTNPSATVHVTAGGAGNREKLQSLSSEKPSWYAGGLDTSYGFGELTVHNNTHVTWSYYRSDTGDLYDSFTLVQESHP